ncbi:MAG TPA: hypothetical protein VKK61_10000 [Tepidisphaeraceae bacterium]|nr:hypothetical protein [Tepidisphaeraceae bacterium]
MSRIKLFLAIVAVMILSSISLRADDATTQPAKEKEATPHVPSPYSKLTLTDDQKTKIGDLHQKATSEIKAIEKQEDDDIMALLTDDQKTELKKIEDDRKAQAKAKRAEKKTKGSDTSGTPAGDKAQ